MLDIPEALRPAVHDINTASPVRVVRVESTPPGADECWLQIVGTIGLIGIAPGHNVAGATDQLHDWVLECLPELGFPAVWPECPEHPATHPLSAGAVHGEPVWICPRTQTVHARIGQLAGGV
ncbi:hypothetical protein [Actinoplanes sp. HUAS TT8]|uniref:hypothetical protein n=1 Tax=Actinoplanes sp. HUAS TT8 TaxID=3447453 RepID=UPI003F51D060